MNTVSIKVPGSTSACVNMFHCGLPSFYITINPADVYNPIVQFLAGNEFDLDNMLPEIFLTTGNKFP